MIEIDDRIKHLSKMKAQFFKWMRTSFDLNLNSVTTQCHFSFA